MTHRLKRLPSGATAVFDDAYRETMHPGLGPWQEANRLYVEGSGLTEMLTDVGPSPDSNEVVVFDVGLGAAANALAAIDCRERIIKEKGRAGALHLVSFESDPAALRFALAHAEQLGYLLGHEPMLETLLRNGNFDSGKGLRWDLRQGDFTRMIQQEPARADVVFYDPFSPRTNPAMWSLVALEGIYRCRRPGGLTRLVTYSTAPGVRAGLMLAGFFVGEGVRLDRGRATTEAATYRWALKDPLDGVWLRRWRHGRDPWPPQLANQDRKRLRKALTEHPQWEQVGETRKPGRREASGQGRKGKATGSPARRKVRKGERRLR